MSGEVIESKVPVMKPLWAKSVDAAVFAMDTSKKGFAALALEDGRISVHETHTGDQIWTKSAHIGSVLQIGVSASGKYLASSGEDGFLRIFEFDSQRLFFEVKVANDWADQLRWAPRDDFPVVAAGKVCVGISVVDKSVCHFQKMTGTISCLDWLDADRFGLGCYGSLCLFSRTSIKPTKTFLWKGSLISLKFSPGGKYAVCGAQDQTIHIWDIESGEDLAMRGFKSKPRLLDFHFSGNWMATASGESLTVWDFRGAGPEGKKPIQLSPTQSPIQVLKYQNHQHIFFTCDKAGAVLLWSPRRSEMPVGIAGVLDHPANCAAWTPDDSMIITGLKAGHILAYALPNEKS